MVWRQAFMPDCRRLSAAVVALRDAVEAARGEECPLKYRLGSREGDGNACVSPVL